MKTINIIGLLLLFCVVNSTAQFKGNTWCFGDSAGILFKSNGQKITFKSTIKASFSYTSITDPNDSLILYAGTSTSNHNISSLKNGCDIFNSIHTKVLNSDSVISGNRQRQQLIIIPKPLDSSVFYLFVFPSIPSVQYYSIIDMKLNNGLGSVAQKNIQLYDKRCTDWVIATKSGNGIDWWLITHRVSAQPSDTFVLFKVTSQGVIGPIYQAIGSPFIASESTMAFNSDGTKFILLSYSGLIEEYNFNRCDGTISLSRTIRQLPQFWNPPYYSSATYSSNDRFFYFTSTVSGGGFPEPTILYQIDLWASNPWSTRDTLWYFSLYYPFTFIRLAPDKRIYVAINGKLSYSNPFPYSDTTYNIYNMNLGVIKKPNKKGAACDFQPFSFYLGGARTYSGLPYNPDYAMGPLVGSPCDTITSLPGPLTNEGGTATLQTTYVSEWQKLFINAQHIKGKNCVLKIFDINGREVFSSSKKTQPPYYTQDVDVGNLSSGLYVVNLITEKESLTTKFVKN